MIEHGYDLLDKVGLTKLPGADIHREIEPGCLRPKGPPGELSASRFQHPLAQSENQADFLHAGNKLRRWQKAPAGMLPSHQRLRTHDPAAIYLRLKVENEVLSLPALV